VVTAGQGFAFFRDLCFIFATFAVKSFGINILDKSRCSNRNYRGARRQQRGKRKSPLDFRFLAASSASSSDLISLCGTLTSFRIIVSNLSNSCGSKEDIFRFFIHFIHYRF